MKTSHYSLQSSLTSNAAAIHLPFPQLITAKILRLSLTILERKCPEFEKFLRLVVIGTSKSLMLEIFTDEVDPDQMVKYRHTYFKNLVRTEALGVAG